MSEFNGTPHNTAKVGEIAKTVLMPGDPLRAKFIAENFLEDAKEFNHVRGMLGYTGKYKGHEISVMGHGMGIPSIAIYSYELYNFYGVENIVRIGSCGGLDPAMDLYDVILAEAGANKINVIKEIRAITGLGLKEAKDLVDGAPKTVKESAPKAEADEIKAKLEAAGAKVELK